MKKIIMGLLLFYMGMIIGGIIVFNNIKVDGVDELDYGIITIECFGHYFDYYYEHNEIIKGE